MNKKILRAPRVKKIGHIEKTGNENTGFFNAVLDSRKKLSGAPYIQREKGYSGICR